MLELIAQLHAGCSHGQISFALTREKWIISTLCVTRLLSIVQLKHKSRNLESSAYVGVGNAIPKQCAHHCILLASTLIQKPGSQFAAQNFSLSELCCCIACCRLPRAAICLAHSSARGHAGNDGTPATSTRGASAAAAHATDAAHGSAIKRTAKKTNPPVTRNSGGGEADMDQTPVDEGLARRTLRSALGSAAEASGRQALNLSKHLASFVCCLSLRTQ